MLDDNRLIYEQLASAIPDYKTADRNWLIFECEKEVYNSDRYNQLLSAIICRYWRLINKFYQKSKDIATEYDCYEWLINSITYTLKHASWKDPESSIYNDSQAGDRMINQCMASQRLTYYQQHNRLNRKINYNLCSIDLLSESNIDIEDTSNCEDLDFNIYIMNLIQKLINLNFYMEILILDCSLNYNLLKDNEFDKTRLKRYLSDLDEKYCAMMCSEYMIDKTVLLEFIENYKNLSYMTADKFIEKSINNLKGIIKKDYGKEITNADRVVKYVKLW